MRWPWVSRERLEEVERRLAEVERERRLVWDRLAMLRGEPPMFARPEPVTVVTTAAPERLDETEAKPATPQKRVMAGSVTFEQVTAAAANAVRQGVH